MDYMIWVGRQFYPTVADYVEESNRLGCCRKVNVVPKDLELGKSRIWLVHREENNDIASLFGYFVFDGMVACSLKQEQIDDVRSGIPVAVLGPELRTSIPQRGCGVLDPPSYYLVGPNDVTVELGLREPFDRFGEKIHVLSGLVPIDGLAHFRGIKQAFFDELHVRVILGTKN